VDPLLFPWLAEIGLITYRDMKAEKRPPLPSELVSVFVVFGAFTLVSKASPGIASALGWGIVLATGMQVFGAINSSAIAKATGDSASAKPGSSSATGTQSNEGGGVGP
jgi:hypothetical protein